MSFLLTLFLSLIVSAFIVYFTLKREDDYNEKSIFPLDVITIVVAILLILLSYFSYVKSGSLFFDVLFVSYVATVSYIDLRISYVYDLHVLIYSIVLLVVSSIVNGFDASLTIYGFLVGLLFYGIIYLLSKLYYGKDAFGLGDVFILAGLGLFLGPIKTIIVGFMSFYFAVIVILIFVIMKIKIVPYSELPFAPYILTSAFVVIYYFDFLSSIWFKII